MLHCLVCVLFFPSLTNLSLTPRSLVKDRKRWVLFSNMITGPIEIFSIIGNPVKERTKEIRAVLNGLAHRHKVNKILQGRVSGQNQSVLQTVETRDSSLVSTWTLLTSLENYCKVNLPSFLKFNKHLKNISRTFVWIEIKDKRFKI